MSDNTLEYLWSMLTNDQLLELKEVGEMDDRTMRSFFTELFKRCLISVEEAAEVTTYYAGGKPCREERVRIPIDSVLPEMEKQEQEYTGFLLIQCEDCGKIRGFCAKSPISSYICECGHSTRLNDLKPALLRCRKCGENFKYRTNIRSERFAYSCLNCGKRNRLFLNSDGDTYITAL